MAKEEKTIAVEVEEDDNEQQKKKSEKALLLSLLLLIFDWVTQTYIHITYVQYVCINFCRYNTIRA